MIINKKILYYGNFRAAETPIFVTNPHKEQNIFSLYEYK